MSRRQSQGKQAKTSLHPLRRASTKPIPAIAGKSYQSRDPIRGQGPHFSQHRTQKAGKYRASPRSLL